MLAESAYWRVILNRNQNLLGKCMLVLRRHEELVTQLTPDEWFDLQHQIVRVTRMLTEAFGSDHFNYAFLQNQDRHVHLYVIPRYAHEREFADLIFADPDYPDHYTVPAPSRLLNEAQTESIADFLRQRASVDRSGSVDQSA